MPDPITPILPDPQASVDAALGSIATPTSLTPTTPATPAVEQPKVEVPPASMPVSAPVGDETPLAFAAPTLNAMPTTPTPTPEPTPTTAPVMPAATASAMPEAPKLEPMPSVGSSYLPPVPPAPISTPPVEAKPKNKSKLMFVMIGVFALLGGLGFLGYFGYTNYYKTTTGQIAALYEVTDPKDCTGCNATGYAVIWKNGACKASNTLCGGSNNDVPPVNPPDAPSEVAANNGTCGNGYYYCGGQIDKCVSESALTSAGGGCNKYGEVVYGIATVYGANPGKRSCDPAKIANKTETECSCGGKTYCFDRGGSCNSTPITRSDGSVVDTGFCGIVGSTVGGVFKENKNLFNPDGTLKYKFNCDLNGCSTSDANCKIMHYTCDGTKTGSSCVSNPTNPTGTGGETFKGACGKVEQIDVMCGGYVESRTSINPPCDTTEENPVSHKACNVTTKVCETVTGPGADTCVTDANCVTAAPVLACTGLTNTPAAPTLGQTVTFTCAGTITPTGAAALSYKFRYSLDDGADQLLTNKTPTTAELTINACGTYSVQCKVCATIAGVLKCDPTWTGAVQ